MADLFDEEPRPNSPEDLGGTFTPRRERRPKPWDPAHKDHPSQRPGNELKPGEDAPTSWNVANIEMGIAEMRKFLEWCEANGIDAGGESVGTLYTALNAHSKAAFRWLCQQLKRCGFDRLPPVGRLDRAIKARDAALLYDSGED